MIFSEITEIPKAIIVPMMPKDAANIGITRKCIPFRILSKRYWYYLEKISTHNDSNFGKLATLSLEIFASI